MKRFTCDNYITKCRHKYDKELALVKKKEDKFEKYWFGKISKKIIRGSSKFEGATSLDWKAYDTRFQRKSIGLAHMYKHDSLNIKFLVGNLESVFPFLSFYVKDSSFETLREESPATVISWELRATARYEKERRQ